MSLPAGSSLRATRHHRGLMEAGKGTLESSLDQMQWGSRGGGGEMERMKPLPWVLTQK